MAENYVTESYLRRKIEVGVIARALGNIFCDLAYPSHFHLNGVVDKDWYSHGRIALTVTDGSQYPHFADIIIHDRFYQSGGRVLVGNPTDVSSNVGTTGQYSTERNHSQSDIVHQVDETVTLEQSQSSTLERGITLDLTTKASAGYGGVSAELETHLGITKNQSQTVSSSKTTSRTFSDTEIIKPGEEVVIVYQKTTKHYTQAFSIDGVADLDFSINLNSTWSPAKLKYIGGSDCWYKDQYGVQSARFKTLHDFISYVLGYDPRAPQMSGYQRHMSHAAAGSLDTLKSNPHGVLNLVLKGTDRITHEGDADYSVQDINGLDDDKVKQLYGKAGNPV